MLSAGTLNHRITIEQNEPATNIDGTQIENWITVDTVWADYQANSGKEFFSAQRFSSEVNAIFRIRYRSGLSTKMRIRHNDRIFGILYLNDTGKDQGELILACREVV